MAPRFIPICIPMALLLLASWLPPPLAAASPVRFFAFGDLPYQPLERERLETLLADVQRHRPPFLVHIGDIKSGTEPCTEVALGRMAELFRAQPVPIVYTPGDNEWTDCRRVQAGAYDPQERLAVLRRLYFADPQVLRLSALDISQPDAAYPENYWFKYRDTFFVTLHLVGSNNNQRPGDATANREFRARSAVNRRHLQAAVAAANATAAQAFVLLFHADPGFEQPSPPRGFARFYRDLHGLLQGFSGPILAIHGDSHSYRIDHPIADPATGAPWKDFTRLEVPGSPWVAGVWVSLDPQATPPVTVELAFADSRFSVFQ